MDPATREFLETEPVNLRDRPRKRAGIIPSGIVQKLIIGGLNFVKQHSTFFRVHATAFTVIPLIFAGIFYASNGRFHISFLDSLFLCYSAMTVTGLSTINLSTLTTWQQFILYFLMTIGDITIVSWIMVLVRKHFFATHCEYVVAKRKHPLRAMSLRSRASFLKTISGPIGEAFKQQEPTPWQSRNSPSVQQTTPNVQFVGPTPSTTLSNTLIGTKEPVQGVPSLFLSQPLSSSPQSAHEELPPTNDHDRYSFRSPTSDRPAARSPQVGFALSTTISPRVAHYHPMMTTRNGRVIIRRGATMIRSDVHNHEHTKDHKFGGFPGPLQLISRLFKRAAPRTHDKFDRTMSMDTYTTLQSQSVPWLNFDGLVVGRNSNFHTESLTDEELEDVGGAEYRALKLLSILVPSYFVLCQLFSVILFLPWLSSTHQYDGVFEAQFRLVSKPWFAFFQVMGAYTGGGLSLVDLGMVPFSNAYLMIVALIFVILAGNHALPIFLRLIIWLASKFLPDDSELQQALSFLLDHPRRCFLYLFPSHQTWFLVICLVLFSTIEWVAFLVLNIGLPAYEAIPTGPRVIAGFFQGLAARASGFAITPIASLAPALQFLYVVMMYIAVYPVALSIRSTNVYEERSLGIFEAPPDDEDEEPEGLDKIKSRSERVGRYLGWHLHRQLSIDIWWLVWAVFIVAIIERAKLLDESMKWFDLFRVLFELVSAFGGIGLSLGLPTDNFSFSGALHPLSKLVVIVIMVRGRHRGLPVAVDRAVVLPSELVTDQNKESNEKINGQSPDDHALPALNIPA